MRIITGSHKGRRLKVSGGDRVRPTSGRVRAAIFDILPLDLSGVRVLDLYAGSGALGLEALSRGALSAVFVDSGDRALPGLVSNLRAMNAALQCRVMAKKVMPALKLLAAEGARFDLCFADPPYASRELDKVLGQLSALGLLSEEAMVVIEHDSAKTLSERYDALARVDHREYGGTAVTFYRRSME